MSDTEKQKRAAAQEAGQMAWKNAARYAEEIKRISLEGPKPEDKELVRSVFCMVCGELLFRASDEVST